MQFIDLKTQYQRYKEEIHKKMQEVLDNTAFIMGPHVKQLEERLAAYCGAKFGIACASGTDALLLPLMAHDIQPGDEVITTPFTFISTSEVIALLKAKPVFVDIEDITYNIDVNKIEAAITPRTKGIIAVDIFGQCTDYDAINAIAKKHGLFVIEDAAQSFGALYKGRKSGSLTDIAATSFFPAKPLGCYGDGGMIFTDDEAKAALMRSYSLHGKGGHKYDNVRIGINGRLDSLQAAVLLVKMDHFDDEVQARQKVAQRYSEALKNLVKVPQVVEGNLSVYAQYCIRVSRREELQKYLKSFDIPSEIYYPKPLHLQEAFGYLGYKAGDFPVTESVCSDIVALPMHPFLNEEQQELIIRKVTEFYQL
jgi:UDP-2-acetamido-2-deoxy-ribo-hexuluronate aminotransferase